MREEKDFNGFEYIFASTSQVGQPGPDVGMGTTVLKDAFAINTLSEMDIIVTCQGSDYTKRVYPDLKKTGWEGYWIDTASALRMEEDSVIVLDPVNRDVIDRSLSKGTKNFIGGNCTVSLMLMAIGGLFKKGIVEWLSSMTYQAASGAGANHMRELIEQMAAITNASKGLTNSEAAILDLDSKVARTMNEKAFPVNNFGAPLAGNVLPWIDSPMETGQSREEWKGFAETNKILQTSKPIPVDGICARIGALRCHSQALTIKLTQNISIEDITAIIAGSNEWVKVIPNTKEDSIKFLTPAAVTGNLTIAVGRIRKLNIGPQYITVFTVGDQLLWGAAEPIRRILKIILKNCF
jgi:aspartate-semialdehyde dehydrogenase